MSILEREPVQLDGATLQAIDQAIIDERPDLEPGLDDIELDRLVQPYFSAHTLLVATCGVPFPARSVVLALGPAGEGRPLLLSHNLARLQAVAAAEPPSGLEERGRARDYAGHGNDWTTPSLNGELALASFDHIPWHELDEAGRVEVARLSERFAPTIQPEVALRTANGWTFHSWLVADRQLIERRLSVPPDGRLERADRVHVRQLPVPEGNVWDLRDGRWVPVG
ncbi:MAG: hypothetical protein IPI67_34115 [Myxococcales bacterium]|nr:hypothetical protein [Myxococcales bacterium]